MNPYTELDLRTTASPEEIKQRYRTLAQMYHPDKGGDEELFKRIKLAYEILSDPIRRKQYDITGETRSTSTRDEALSNIIQIVLQVVPSFNAEKDNLIKIAEKETQAMLDRIYNDLSTTSMQIKKLEVVLNKLRIKTEGENILTGVINGQIQAKKEEIAGLTKSVRVCMLMKEILKDYEYGLVNIVFNQPEDGNGGDSQTRTDTSNDTSF
jgi:curved DNA-binding protein CbpA